MQWGMVSEFCGSTIFLSCLECLKTKRNARFLGFGNKECERLKHFIVKRKQHSSLFQTPCGDAGRGSENAVMKMSPPASHHTAAWRSEAQTRCVSHPQRRLHLERGLGEGARGGDPSQGDLVSPPTGRAEEVGGKLPQEDIGGAWQLHFSVKTEKIQVVGGNRKRRSIKRHGALW